MKVFALKIKLLYNKEKGEGIIPLKPLMED